MEKRPSTSTGATPGPAAKKQKTAVQPGAFTVTGMDLVTMGWALACKSQMQCITSLAAAKQQVREALQQLEATHEAILASTDQQQRVILDSQQRRVEVQRADLEQRNVKVFTPSKLASATERAVRDRVGAHLDSPHGQHCFWMLRLVYKKREYGPPLEEGDVLGPKPGARAKCAESAQTYVLIGEEMDFPDRGFSYQDCLLMVTEKGMGVTREQAYSQAQWLTGFEYVSADHIMPCANWRLFTRVNVWPSMAMKVCQTAAAVPEPQTWGEFIDNHLQIHGVKCAHLGYKSIQDRQLLAMTKGIVVQNDLQVQRLVARWLVTSPYSRVSACDLEKQVMDILFPIVRADFTITTDTDRDTEDTTTTDPVASFFSQDTPATSRMQKH